MYKGFGTAESIIIIPIKAPCVANSLSEKGVACAGRDTIDPVVRTHEAACSPLLHTALEWWGETVLQILDCHLLGRYSTTDHANSTSSSTLTWKKQLIMLFLEFEACEEE